jgi:hypothetical protein
VEITSNRTSKAGVNKGIMYFFPKKRSRISTNKTRSLINDSIEVKGIQSPKQPQVEILPERAA